MTDLAIGDGEVAPPQVGDTGRYALLFTETPPDETDPSIVTVTVDVEPLDDGVPLFQPAATTGFRDEERWWEWRLFLRGDGWTATWYSRRPLLGRQRLTGRIIGDLGYATTGSVTGRILRARIVSDTYRLAEQSSSEPARPPRWVPVPGTRRFQDLAAATGVFRDDTRPSDSWRRPDQRKRGAGRSRPRRRTTTAITPTLVPAAVSPRCRCRQLRRRRSVAATRSTPRPGRNRHGGEAVHCGDREFGALGGGSRGRPCRFRRIEEERVLATRHFHRRRQRARFKGFRIGSVGHTVT
ncbi:hypothetical protein [Rhodococcus gordoniae]|uniref:hypothetical protein n=1 Tax=Rhodococcus gordoniae TaxID=223392 RepID=UPI001FD72563|nr:hypothetical protein [Rhodococcus gordoniae]